MEENDKINTQGCFGKGFVLHFKIVHLSWKPLQMRPYSIYGHPWKEYVARIVPHVNYVMVYLKIFTQPTRSISIACTSLGSSTEP